MASAMRCIQASDPKQQDNKTAQTHNHQRTRTSHQSEVQSAKYLHLNLADIQQHLDLPHGSEKSKTAKTEAAEYGEHLHAESEKKRRKSKVASPGRSAREEVRARAWWRSFTPRHLPSGCPHAARGAAALINIQLPPRAGALLTPLRLPHTSNTWPSSVPPPPPPPAAETRSLPSVGGPLLFNQADVMAPQTAARRTPILTLNHRAASGVALALFHRSPLSRVGVARDTTRFYL